MNQDHDRGEHDAEPTVTRDSSRVSHTPGPWSLRDDFDVVDAYGAVVAETVSEGNVSEHEQAANAQLIAAAPEILAALRDMISEWSVLGRINTETWDRARDASAKAEGY